MSVHIAPCFSGPIDIVGDVHGEIEPLLQLLAQLGYDSRGRHAQRRLVFIGDLIDRGPDSPAVLEFVRELVMAEQAQCLLGNHELLLLLGESKEGCRWYADPQHPEQQPGGRFAHSRPAPSALKPLWREFVAGLPLALERDDLRLVHACWQSSAIEALRADDRSLLEIYTAYERSIELALQQEGKIRHIGLSNVTPAQLRDAMTRAKIVCVSNLYNVAHGEQKLGSLPHASTEGQEAIVNLCAEHGMAFLPFFLLAIPGPRRENAALTEIAERHGKTLAQVAIAWLLARSPTIVPIAGTSRVAHLEDNWEARRLALSKEEFDAISAARG